MDLFHSLSSCFYSPLRQPLLGSSRNALRDDPNNGQGDCCLLAHVFGSSDSLLNAFRLLVKDARDIRIIILKKETKTWPKRRARQ